MADHKTEKIIRGVFLLLAFFYAAVIIRMVFLKDGLRLEAGELHLMPFNVIRQYKSGIKSFKSVIINYAGNIALFFPLGIFLPIIFKKLGFLKVILAGFFISAFIEIAQYLLSVGYTDADDIIMNTIGAVAGAFIYFYIFDGKRKSVISYILSLFVILAMTVGGIACIWRYAPNLLPEKAVVINGMIAGRRLDSYDLYAKCKGMSRGEVAMDKETASDKSGRQIENIPRTYFILDTAVFVTVSEKNGKNIYHIIGIDEMIEKVMGGERPYLTIWLDKENKCSIIMLKED